MENELTSLIASDILDTDQAITPQSDLFAAGLDSMGIMQLLLLIEDRFGVEIDPADLSRDNFSTAEKIAALVAEKKAASSR
ncbi:phosphopantetheine-binding protein [Luteolibacter flavescens]|uniref:Phosphopantetheine-binding protein n=1 Tax=Luteolibacter flavescens TaxID=1859460 RepID=A0ABT3FTG8_9BACT|nr:phosphopantetheine-binding protein [Luteolibacter flavescens]MCW1886873.1 phosphopantetheine-binding protein [Luteolibacter flavescens]